MCRFLVVIVIVLPSHNMGDKTLTRTGPTIWGHAISPELIRLAYNKLVLINAAESINDLRIPPGNRLEKLTGDRAGQYSVRVNNQWRICFTWSSSGASNVELVDYH